MIKGIKKYGKADRRCDLGNLIVVWGMMPLLMGSNAAASEVRIGSSELDTFLDKYVEKPPRTETPASPTVPPL